MRVREAFRLVLVAFIASMPGMAQSTNAIVSGLVLDPSGRPIVGADVEMVNDATGVRYPGATNGEGIYQIPNLPPGPYRLQVSEGRIQDADQAGHRSEYSGRTGHQFHPARGSGFGDSDRRGRSAADRTPNRPRSAPSSTGSSPRTCR